MYSNQPCHGCGSHRHDTQSQLESQLWVDLDFASIRHAGRQPPKASHARRGLTPNATPSSASDDHLSGLGRAVDLTSAHSIAAEVPAARQKRHRLNTQASWTALAAAALPTTPAAFPLHGSSSSMGLSAQNASSGVHPRQLSDQPMIPLQQIPSHCETLQSSSSALPSANQLQRVSQQPMQFLPTAQQGSKVSLMPGLAAMLRPSGEPVTSAATRMIPVRPLTERRGNGIVRIGPRNSSGVSLHGGINTQRQLGDPGDWPEHAAPAEQQQGNNTSMHRLGVQAPSGIPQHWCEGACGLRQKHPLQQGSHVCQDAHIIDLTVSQEGHSVPQGQHLGPPGCDHGDPDCSRLPDQSRPCNTHSIYQGGGMQQQPNIGSAGPGQVLLHASAMPSSKARHQPHVHNAERLQQVSCCMDRSGIGPCGTVPLQGSGQAQTTSPTGLHQLDGRTQPSGSDASEPIWGGLAEQQGPGGVEQQQQHCAALAAEQPSRRTKGNMESPGQHVSATPAQLLHRRPAQAGLDASPDTQALAQQPSPDEPSSAPPAYKEMPVPALSHNGLSPVQQQQQPEFDVPCSLATAYKEMHIPALSQHERSPVPEQQQQQHGKGAESSPRPLLEHVGASSLLNQQQWQQQPVQLSSTVCQPNDGPDDVGLTSSPSTQQQSWEPGDLFLSPPSVLKPFLKPIKTSHGSPGRSCPISPGLPPPLPLPVPSFARWIWS